MSREKEKLQINASAVSTLSSVAPTLSTARLSRFDCVSLVVHVSIHLLAGGAEGDAV